MVPSGQLKKDPFEANWTTYSSRTYAHPGYTTSDSLLKAKEFRAVVVVVVVVVVMSVRVGCWTGWQNVGEWTASVTVAAMALSLSVSVSLYLSLSRSSFRVFELEFSLCVSLSVCLSVCLSVSMSVWLSRCLSLSRSDTDRETESYVSDNKDCTVYCRPTDWHRR